MNVLLCRGSRARPDGRIASCLAAVTFALAGLLVTSATSASAAPKQKPECADRIDNDGDGLVDYARKGGDPDCTSRQDSIEAAEFRCMDLQGPDGLFETPPPVPNAEGGCDLSTGEVYIEHCNLNYWNLNEVITDGCEYGPIAYTGDEVCDGVDNDADGQVDDGVLVPTAANGWVVCREGVLVLFCEAGFSDINGDLSDGCEFTEPT